MTAARRLILAVLCVLAGALMFSEASALAVTKYVQVSSFGSSALPSSPWGVAVDQASGEVFVADGESVQRVAPVNRANPSAGYSLGSPLAGSFTFAIGVAVDDSGGLSQGAVYVVDAGAKAVDKFDASGLPDVSTPQIGAGASPLALSEPTGAAVDPANGDVYVSDSANSVVDVFTPTGEFVSGSQFATEPGPSRLAFNSTGSDLYVVAGGQVEEFDAAGNHVDQTAGPNAGTNVVDDSESPNAVAVDPATNAVYVHQAGNSNIAVFESSGAPLSPSEFPVEEGPLFGLAVDGSTGAVYVPEYFNKTVNVFRLIVLPEATTGTASNVTETGATLNGTVNPEGVPLTSCQFKYQGGTSSEQTVPCSELPSGSGTELVQVHANVEGLQPGATYSFHLEVSNANGTSKATGESFITPSPPIVGSESFSEVRSTTATLSAQVNAEGSPSTYRFEYGTSTSYGSTTSPASLGSAQGDVNISAQLSDLVPGAVYHFRVLASNAHGVGHGVDATFTTYPPTLSSLPDGRVYEMVTPPENQNANVYVPSGPGASLVYGAGGSQGHAEGENTSLPFQASTDGDTVTYVAAPALGGNGREGAGIGGNQYLATRAPGGGWAQQNIQPEGYSSPVYQAFSSDLSVGILQSRESLATGAPGGTLGSKLGYMDLYARTLGDGDYQPLFTTTPPDRTPEEFGAFAPQEGEITLQPLLYAGASADFSHLLFEANDALTSTPSALDGGKTEDNLYDSLDGRLSLVNVLPDGVPDPNASFGSSPPAPSFGENPPDFSHAISADGSRIFWTDLNTDDLYVRENGATTVQVDASVGGGGVFQTTTADGSEVFFTKGDLYEYDLENGQTTDLAPGGEVQGVIGASEDGSYVYFTANGALASGATPENCASEEDRCNLYVWHDGETKFIAALSGSDNRGARGGTSDWQLGFLTRTAEVTPAGGSVVFMSNQSLTGHANGGLSEVFVYDAEMGRLFCASCNPSGEPASGNGGQYGTVAAYLPPGWSNTYLPHWISDDGSRVFFDSLEALLPQDINGRQDVYEWERDGVGSCQRSEGCIYLLSGGTSDSASSLLAANPSGDDVFIATRAQLLPEDRNESFDVYDARVGGVLRTAPPGCSGASCQGAPPASPVFASPASSTFLGSGNLSAPAPVKVAAKPKSKALTRAQQLAAALKACARKRASRRAVCRTNARKLYGAKSKAKKPAKGRK